MKGPTPRRLRKYVSKCLGLKAYLQRPGDGRPQGRIPAATPLWALLMGALLRRAAFAAIEALVCSRARRALEVARSFGDDALGYFTERLDPAVTRRAVVIALRQAKRHKAFDDCGARLAPVAPSKSTGGVLARRGDGYALRPALA